jgi:hypothetical protein
MFLPAQLICRPKLGLQLSLYYMWRKGGGPYLFNAKTDHYYIRIGAGSFVSTAHAGTGESPV